MSTIVQHPLAGFASGCAFALGEITVAGSSGEPRRDPAVRVVCLGRQLEKAS